MKKYNPTRYSSAVGEAWLHCMFKVKYCHNIFDDEIYREAMHMLLLEAAYDNDLVVGEFGFDSNHVHFLVDVGLHTRPEVARLLKGTSAKHFFEFFPELKLPKHKGGKFWGSGFWNPSYYLASPKDLAGAINYIRKQKYGADKDRQQRTLGDYAQGS